MAVCSIVDLATVSIPLRYDSEYWRPEFLAFDKQVRTTGGLIKKYIKQIIQPSEFLREYDTSPGNPEFWRSQNIKRGYIDRSTAAFIDSSIFGSIPNAQVKEGDVLIVRTGVNAGDAATVPQGIERVAVSSHTLRIVPNDISTGYALGMFFASDLGRSILHRVISGSSRKQITKEMIESLMVPDFSLIANELVERTRQYYQVQNQAIALYTEAEALLLRELHLGIVALPTAKTYTASFSEVMASERMDAEYYQPRYYALLSLLQKTGAAGRLGNYLRSPVKRGVQPSYVEGGELPVIKSQHIGARSIVLDDPDSRTSYEFGEIPKNRRALVGYEDVLLNSTGMNTIGRCQPLLQKTNALADGHVAILRCGAALDPVYLSTFLNSTAGYMQTERAWTGSSGQIELRPELVEDYTIWLAPMELQRTIRDMIESAHQLRESATGLLAAAQKRVEEFIQRA